MDKEISKSKKNKEQMIDLSNKIEFATFLKKDSLFERTGVRYWKMTRSQELLDYSDLEESIICKNKDAIVNCFENINKKRMNISNYLKRNSNSFLNSDALKDYVTKGIAKKMDMMNDTLTTSIENKNEYDEYTLADYDEFFAYLRRCRSHEESDEGIEVIVVGTTDQTKRLIAVSPKERNWVEVMVAMQELKLALSKSCTRPLEQHEKDQIKRYSDCFQSYIRKHYKN